MSSPSDPGRIVSPVLPSTGADLSGANLSGADLSGANLSRARGDSSTRLPAGLVVDETGLIVPRGEVSSS